MAAVSEHPLYPGGHPPRPPEVLSPGRPGNGVFRNSFPPSVKEATLGLGGAGQDQGVPVLVWTEALWTGKPKPHPHGQSKLSSRGSEAWALHSWVGRPPRPAGWLALWRTAYARGSELWGVRCPSLGVHRVFCRTSCNADPGLQLLRRGGLLMETWVQIPRESGEAVWQEASRVCSTCPCDVVAPSDLSEP